MSNDLRFKWFGCQLMCEPNDFGCQLLWDSIGCQTIWDSNDLVVSRFGVQASRRFLFFFARLPSKMKLWSSKTQLFCEISFKNQKSKFEAQKRSFSTRLPSKMKLWSSKPKLFCETSFKNNALKLKNEAFLRDFLQKWHVDQTLGLRVPIRFSDFEVDASKYCACHKKVEPRHTNSCNCHAKWSLLSNASLTWNLQPSTGSASEASNIDITKHEIPAPAMRNGSFRTLFESTTLANVFATLTNSCACHVFCNVPKSPRLPREKHFESPKTPRDRQFLRILTSKSLSRAGVVQILANPTSKSDPQRGVFSLKSLSRAGVVLILSASSAADPLRHLAFRSWLCESSKPRNYGKTQPFAQFLPAKISYVSHLCCQLSI